MIDTGLHSLVAIARFYQLPAEPDQLTHEFCEPGSTFSDTHILQAAKALTLKAKLIRSNTTALKPGVLPAIAKHKDGSYFIIARLAESAPDAQEASSQSHKKQPAQNDYSGALIHDLREEAPRTVSLAALDEIWSGEMIALVRLHNLGESLQKHFDISWFIPSLIKYRKLFGEVLIASFFLQLFALVTPLFFQVVMDKGRIVEQGNHDQLLKHNGYYAKLHSYQNHTPSLQTVEKPEKPIKSLELQPEQS